MAIKSIIRISTDANGVEANGFSWRPVFSPDSSKVAFESWASNLVSGDTNRNPDIFVKDLVTGAIQRASTDANGLQGNSQSHAPVFSPDGGKVAFYSPASNLVPDSRDVSIWDIFIKDLVTGAIERISTDANGVKANGDSYFPVFSPDGSKVAFSSQAPDLVPGDTNGDLDIFVKDLATGAVERVSTDANGLQGISYSHLPVFSPDGGKVAFYSDASNLVPGDTNGRVDIFVKDLFTGVIARVSTDANGIEGDNGSSEYVFSPDGSKVAFQSYASNLVPGDTNNAPDIFVKDLFTGAIARVSTDANGAEGNHHSNSPAFSPDGSKVAFQSYAPNLVLGDTNNAPDIFVKDVATGAIARLSTDASGTEGNNGSWHPVFAPDGAKLVFSSAASNLVPGDTKDVIDIFVVELADAWVSPPPVSAWSIMPESVRVGEAASTLTFTVSRSDSTLVQIVHVSTVENQGAVNDGDYVGKAKEPLVFVAGEHEKTVTIEILDDDIPEDDETFGLVVKTALGEMLASATFTILDNDVPPEPLNLIMGTDRNDRLVGTDGDDIIFGLAGNDRLEGRDGNDILFGGLGNGRLDGGPGDNILVGGPGNDELIGGPGLDVAIFADDYGDFRITKAGPRVQVQDRVGSEGNNTLTAVEILQFNNGFLDLGNDSFNEGYASERVAALMTRPGFTTDPDPLVLDHGDYWL